MFIFAALGGVYHGTEDDGPAISDGFPEARKIKTLNHRGR
jgi:hypothetical protein